MPQRNTMKQMYKNLQSYQLFQSTGTQTFCFYKIIHVICIPLIRLVSTVNIWLQHKIVNVWLKIYLKIVPTMFIVSLRSFGKIAALFFSVRFANPLVIFVKNSGSIITVRSELLVFWIFSKFLINICISSLILVISTVEQFSTFGLFHTAGLPLHNLEASPT